MGEEEEMKGWMDSVCVCVTVGCAAGVICCKEDEEGAEKSNTEGIGYKSAGVRGGTEVVEAWRRPLLSSDDLHAHFGQRQDVVGGGANAPAHIIVW